MAMGEPLAVDLYINGAWRPAAAGGTIALIDPATEEKIGTAAQATRADVEAAIDAAVAGFEVWQAHASLGAVSQCCARRRSS